MSLEDRRKTYEQGENGLRQFVFEAIQNYIEEHDHALFEWYHEEDAQMPDPGWVDEYAERPLNEHSGYERIT